MNVSLLMALTVVTLGALGSTGCLRPPSLAVESSAGTDTSSPRDLDPEADLTSMEVVRRMRLGYNLGNTLDSCSGNAADSVTETSWGNPRASEALFLSLKEDGVDSIRIPVTWRHHLGPAPDYVIDEGWMRRVAEVVDYAVDNGLYAIINLHHDGGGDPAGGAWLRNAGTDYDRTMAKFHAVWAQIATRFQDYPHRLVFESMNEVGFDDLPQSEAYAILNKMNQAFVDQIRTTGGNNPTRHLLVAGYFTDIRRSCEGITIPEDPADRCILSVHYYTPWQFCITGKHRKWGNPSELKALESDFLLLKRTFVDRGVPVILGEYGVESSTELASRVFWLEMVTKTAHDMGVAPFFWDNGAEVSRTTYRWRTKGLLEALQRATSGEDYTPTKG